MRVTHQPAFVLRTRPFSESSLLLDLFSRHHGRVAVMAKGVRRLKSRSRGVVMAFAPLVASWSGKGEVATLTAAEPAEHFRPLRGEALMCGYYLNELLLRLVQRGDAHERLFDDYALAVARLAAAQGTEAVLRAFEIALLREIGYALVLDREARGGAPLRPEVLYDYRPDHGPLAAGAADGSPELVTGRTLLALARDDLSDHDVRAEAKRLLRTVLAHRLDGRPLASRRVLRRMVAARRRRAGWPTSCGAE